jgi:hypothetical protein
MDRPSVDEEASRGPPLRRNQQQRQHQVRTSRSSSLSFSRFSFIGRVNFRDGVLEKIFQNLSLLFFPGEAEKSFLKKLRALTF